LFENKAKKSINRSDQKLLAIQKSTRTTLPILIPLHNILRMNSTLVKNPPICYHLTV